MMTLQEKRDRRAARKASELRMAEGRKEAAQALAENRCPVCGGPVRVNLAMTGWVQCAQFGAEGFRADSTRPACSWQGFTK